MQLAPLFLMLLLLSNVLLAHKNPESIELQLCWKHQFQFAGFYIAKEKGFYKNIDLDVTINEYRHSINIVDKVLSTKAAYGVGRSSLLIESSNGKPIAALGAIYQSSPLILISTNPAIKSLKDLRDKRIMITEEATKSASIMSMLHSHGIKKDDFIAQKHSFSYNDLIQHKTDAMASYLSNEPFYLELNNIPFTIFNPGDYGYDFYGDILFTSQKEIATHPERVKKFYAASKKGWLWAFEHIEETAQIIYEKYNSQNKSIESLIYEGKILKTLALIEGINFGHLSKNKCREIANIYQLGNHLTEVSSLDEFVDPLALNKQPVKIGVLAKRGSETALLLWNDLTEYLNDKLEAYHFTIVPLDFNQLDQSVAKAQIDFFITNSIYYVQLEHAYGASRIATLLNTDPQKKQQLKEFGGVIFTRHDNQEIHHINDLKGKSFGAVNERSFGGWIMAYEELVNHDISRDDLQLQFFNTHDAVVNAVLSGLVAAGTVRTDTLEYMAFEKNLDLSNFRIINPRTYKNFPYLVSTRLYPEWPFAKLKNTSDKLANKVLSALINIPSDTSVSKVISSGGWTIPLDYTSVNNTLKKLNIAPYNSHDIQIIDVLKHYAWALYTIILVISLLIVKLLYIYKINKHLDSYNQKLDSEVKERTRQLLKANQRLKVLAQSDPLTGISNRGFFMKQGKKYFNIAVRNKTPLQLLSLDLDHFKRINDLYGHMAGDQVLKKFTLSVKGLLRDSDLFARTGGEEFCILLQSTTLEGAKIFSERIRNNIESLQIKIARNKTISITVSIGLAALKDEARFEYLLKKSDIALYKAKNNGRNQLKLY